MKLFNVVLVDGHIHNRIAVKLIEATDRESAEAEAIRIQQTEQPFLEHEWHVYSCTEVLKSDNGYIIITHPLLREGRR